MHLRHMSVNMLFYHPENTYFDKNTLKMLKYHPVAILGTLLNM